MFWRSGKPAGVNVSHICHLGNSRCDVEASIHSSSQEHDTAAHAAPLRSSPVVRGLGGFREGIKHPGISELDGARIQVLAL